MTFSRTALFLAVTGLAAGTALAGGHTNSNPAVAARQAHMDLYTHNAGILGGMARGNVEYNAEAAMAAASNLAALTKLNQMSYWAPGTSTMDVDGTRALPALWDNIPDAIAKGQQLSAAADAMAAVAGDGLPAVQANIGPIFQVCTACHEAYREPN